MKRSVSSTKKLRPYSRRKLHFFMPLIETVLTPALYEYRSLHGNHTSVAVDILRATTSICAALEAGAECVLPLDTLEGIERYRTQGFQIAAERGGVKVGDAEWGNSPTAYAKSDLTGIRLAFCTTNGTVSILKARESKRLYVGGFCNIDVLSRRLATEQADVVVVCSGWENGVSLEDTLFAGALAERLTTNQRFEPCGDSTTMSLTLWRAAKDNIDSFCASGTHIQRLTRLGSSADIEFALRANTCSVVPAMDRDGLLKRS